MKMNRVFVGNIMKCTKDDIVTIREGGGERFNARDLRFATYKNDAVLIKLGTGKYVDLEMLDSHMDYLYLKARSNNNNNIILSTTSNGAGSLFVDEDTLRPYISSNLRQENVSVKRLKKITLP